MVTAGLPQPNSNGGPMTCWAILDQLRRAGHDVTVVNLTYPDDPFSGEDRQAVVRATGADVVAIPTGFAQGARPTGGSALRRSLRPKLEDVFPTATLRQPLFSALDRLRPDVIIGYHWDALAPLMGYKGAPKMATVGDPWHLPALRQWQQVPARLTRRFLKSSLARARDQVFAPRWMAALLNDFDASGCFQAGAAGDLQRWGAAACQYLPTPLAGPPPTLSKGRPQRGTSAVPRILVGPSNLGATSTKAGLVLLANEILPGLEAALGRDGFRIRIVGEGAAPPPLARRLPHSGIEMTGRIEPPDEEFLASDIQLVPTPFVLGIRVRILTGMAYGTCIVAHESEQVNIPELEDGKNCLLGADGPALVRQILRAAADPALRARVGQGARTTFRETFEASQAAQRILQTLERLGRTERPAMETPPLAGGGAS